MATVTPASFVSADQFVGPSTRACPRNNACSRDACHEACVHRRSTRYRPVDPRLGAGRRRADFAIAEGHGADDLSGYWVSLVTEDGGGGGDAAQRRSASVPTRQPRRSSTWIRPRRGRRSPVQELRRAGDHACRAAAHLWRDDVTVKIEADAERRRASCILAGSRRPASRRAGRVTVREMEEPPPSRADSGGSEPRQGLRRAARSDDDEPAARYLRKNGVPNGQTTVTDTSGSRSQAATSI
jgi:hypothetical protein